jgi:hypothetical protein
MNDTTISREMFPTKDSDTQGVIIINGVVVTVLKYASGVGIVVTTWMVARTWMKSFKITFLSKRPMTSGPLLRILNNIDKCFICH